jgi:type VI secretion system secreted protein VgrG
MTVLQTDRLIRIATALDEQTFVVLSFSGSEQISGLFAFNLELASERSDIAFDQLAGTNATVAVGSSDGTQRFFNGIITGFAPGRMSEKEGFSEYVATLRPAAWLLTQCADCRVFQDMSVPDIVKEVLGAAGGKGIGRAIASRQELSGSYPQREFCLQYNETDMAFIERLCEEEGIFYFFEHKNGQHTLVFADRPEAHKPYLEGGAENVSFQNTLGGLGALETISHLQPYNKLSTGKYVSRDYNFIMPQVDMTVTQTTLNTQPKSSGTIYEYPGGFATASDHGQALAQLRMQAGDARMHTLGGKSNCRGFAPGYQFTLQEHTLAALNNKAYVFTHVRHEARQHFSTGAGVDSYLNYFNCLPHAMAFRPARNHGKPVMAGTQTAIVTGPKGEEIHTDTHARVKVRFAWDRRTDDKGDGNMSCWLRVSQAWAGPRYGALYIPRVGDEVIVSFMDGDPDRPIVTGRVYHGQNKPPYDLPAQKTKSTLKTCSTKQGRGNFNEIRFEDLKGSEEFFTHAARDQNEIIQNDMTTQVKNDQRIEVENHRSLTVSSGNESVTIQSGSREVSVKANEKHTNSADYTHKVSGDFTLKVNGNITIEASGMVKISGAKVILN